MRQSRVRAAGHFPAQATPGRRCRNGDTTIYMLLKLLHVLDSTGLFGTGMGIAFFSQQRELQSCIEPERSVRFLGWAQFPERHPMEGRALRIGGVPVLFLGLASSRQPTGLIAGGGGAPTFFRHDVRVAHSSLANCSLLGAAAPFSAFSARSAHGMETQSQ